VIKLSEKDKKEDPKVDAKGTDEEEEVEVKEKKTRKIQINVSRQKEIDELQKEKAELEAKLEREKVEREEKEQKLADEKLKIEEELAEKQAILEKQALESFEKEKKSLLEFAKERKLTDEQMADIEERLTTPEKLEMVKSLVNMLAPKAPEKLEPEKKTPPTGKATITSPVTRKAGSEEYDSPEALISDLYYKAYYARDGEVTVQERRKALKKIDGLFKALIGGKAWMQLRKNEQRMPNQKVTFCPHCHNVIVGTPDKCPHCGHDLQEKMRSQGEEGEW